MPDIVFIKWDSGDWLQVYYLGNKVYEGHSISPGYLLELCGISYKSYEIDANSDEAEMLSWGSETLDEALDKVKTVIVSYD